MIQQASQLAEALSAGMSRRGFLGWIGKGAAGAAAVLGGVLALPSGAEAGNRCCFYVCPDGDTKFRCDLGRCREFAGKCRLVAERRCKC